MHRDSVKLKTAEVLQARLQHVKDARQRRREARRRAADGALAALPTTTAATDGALSAIDLALDADSGHTHARAPDPAHAAAEHQADDDAARRAALRSLKEDLLASRYGEGGGDARAVAEKSFAAGVKTGATLASLDADFLFPGVPSPGSAPRHGPRISQLGFMGKGNGGQPPLRGLRGNEGGEKGATAQARAADQPAEEEDDDVCRPPMVLYKGKCTDTPSRQPRAWGLPTKRRYYRHLHGLRRYSDYRSRRAKYRRAYARSLYRARKRYYGLERQQYRSRHRSECVSPRVRKGYSCVGSPLRQPRAWGLPAKPYSEYSPKEQQQWRLANKMWERGLHQTRKPRDRSATASLNPRRRYRMGYKSLRHLVPQRFPQRRHSNVILGDNWISGANAGEGYPDRRLSPRERWRRLLPASPFSDHLVKNRRRNLRSKTPEFLRPFRTGGHRHDHDLAHTYWTDQGLDKLYKAPIRQALRSSIFPKDSRTVPIKVVNRQFHPLLPTHQHDRFRPLSKHPERGLEPGRASAAAGAPTAEEQKLLKGANLFSPLEDDMSPAESVLAQKQ